MDPAICSVLVTQPARFPPHVWCELYGIYPCAIQWPVPSNSQPVQNGGIASALDTFLWPWPTFRGKLWGQKPLLKEASCSWKGDKICPSTSIHADFKYFFKIDQWMLYHADSLELNVMTNSFFLLQWQRSIRGCLWGQEWDSRENQCIPDLLLKMCPLIFHNAFLSSAGNGNSYHP